MKAIVAHHLWSRVGGGELVSAYTAKALLDAGHEVAVVSTFGFDTEKYREWFGLNLAGVRRYTLFSRMLPAFGIYQRLGFYLPLRRAIEEEKPDAVFVDSELYKPVLKLREKQCFGLVEYIHFPFHALRMDSGDVPEEYRDAFERYLADARMYSSKYEKGVWRLYFKLWLKLYGRVARDNPFEAANIVLANSTYIARLVSMLWRWMPRVVHPPVRISDLQDKGYRGYHDRDNAVVMIGRISPEKRIETVIDAVSLIPEQKRPVVRVVGGLIPLNTWYFEALHRRAREKNVTLEVYPNAPRWLLADVASKSRVFVHATVGEHFGVAVVEAMAAGLPVVVHRSGGPYEDIIRRDDFGYSFETPEELAEHLETLLWDRRRWSEMHEISMWRATRFSESVFASSITKIMEEAAGAC